METTQRKTAAELHNQHTSLNKQILHAIKDTIQKKEITKIYLTSNNFITINFIDYDSFVKIVSINEEGVIILDQYDNEEELRFEDLETAELLEILDLLEGDISKVKW